MGIGPILNPNPQKDKINKIIKLKKFENKFKPNKKNLYKRVYKAGNKFIYFLQNIRYKLNSFIYNFKTL